MHRSFAVAAALCGAVLAQSPPPGLDQVEPLIDAAALAGHIRFLSHDLLEGRGVGSRGDELTRLYVATQLESLGLQPGVGSSFEQPVPIVGIRSRISETLTARGTDGRELTFQGPDDFTARAGSAEPVAAWRSAELVFAGFGITAPEQQWDDFKDVDVRGKVLLVMNNDPEDDPDLFAGRTRLYYGRWSYKYEEAARRGAAGVLVIHTTPSAGYPFGVIQAGHEQETFHLPFAAGAPTLAIEGWCSEEAARQLAALGGRDLDDLRAAAQTRAFRPVALDVRVSLAARNEVRELRSANVVAVLPGSDPVLRAEYVVVTAHFDHLGIGPEKKGDRIYNGALDNATGTAALLCLARACAALPAAPRRSLLFTAVTAEESGLLGSQWFARNPTVPVKQIVADVNIDGLNIWGATRDIEMVGYGKNSLTDLAAEVAARRGREVRPNQQPDRGYFYRSDHFSFAKVGVPAAYFKAGSEFLEKAEARRRIKAMYETVYYHQPADEFDPERWQLDGAVADLRLILECLLRIAAADRPPAWTAGDEFEKLR